MTRKAFVDKNICIGCSVCTETCPSVFKVKEDSNYTNEFKSFTNDAVDQESIVEAVQQAIDSCPVQCISWREKKAEKEEIREEGTPKTDTNGF